MSTFLEAEGYRGVVAGYVCITWKQQATLLPTFMDSIANNSFLIPSLAMMWQSGIRTRSLVSKLYPIRQQDGCQTLAHLSDALEWQILVT